MFFHKKYLIQSVIFHSEEYKCVSNQLVIIKPNIYNIYEMTKIIIQIYIRKWSLDQPL